MHRKKSVIFAATVILDDQLTLERRIQIKHHMKGFHVETMTCLHELNSAS